MQPPSFKLSETAKKMIMVIGVLSLVVMCAGAIYHRSAAAFPFALGVFLGMAHNVLRVVLIERTVHKLVDITEPAAASNYLRLQSLGRLVLTAAVLAVALLVPFIDLWGAVFGILTFQLAAYSIKLFAKKEFTDENDSDIDSDEEKSSK